VRLTKSESKCEYASHCNTLRHTATQCETAHASKCKNEKWMVSAARHYTALQDTADEYTRYSYKTLQISTTSHLQHTADKYLCNIYLSNIEHVVLYQGVSTCLSQVCCMNTSCIRLQCVAVQCSGKQHAPYIHTTHRTQTRWKAFFFSIDRHT